MKIKEKIFVDANFFIYINASVDDSIRSKYIKFFDSLLNNSKFFTNILVLDELLYRSKKKYEVPYESTLDFIKIFVLNYCNVIKIGKKELSSLFSILSKYKLKPSDAIHVSSMLNNSINKILSEDKDFDYIKEITRIWI